MNVRAKFFCQKVTRHASQGAGQTPTQIDVELGAVTVGEGDVNESWSRWTPSGNLTMCITNPACFGAFEEGKEYFLDISPAE